MFGALEMERCLRGGIANRRERGEEDVLHRALRLVALRVPDVESRTVFAAVSPNMVCIRGYEQTITMIFHAPRLKCAFPLALHRHTCYFLFRVQQVP